MSGTQSIKHAGGEVHSTPPSRALKRGPKRKLDEDHWFEAALDAMAIGGVFDGTLRQSMANVVNQFASRNGCETEATVVREEAGLKCQKRVGCRSDVQWCGVDKVGHQWPGGKAYAPRLLGPNTDRYNASEGIALFFRAQLAN